MSWIDLLKAVILSAWIHILVTAQVSNYLKLKYGRIWKARKVSQLEPESLKDQ